MLNLFEFYWYPLYTAYPLILGLVGVVFSSLLIDYYTVYSAYSDQQKFLRVRSIE
ncbi:MAG: hypothetical protein K1T65_04410 [Candidatus Aramenus sp.]|nr:hypothetical protein [Candidatus Aramenus sp.]